MFCFGRAILSFPSATKMVFLQQCYDVFVSAGFPVKEAALAFNTVAGWMTGVVRSEMTLMPALAAQENQFTKEDVPPEFHGVVDFMDCCNAWTPTQRVEAGLDTLLAGFEKELADKGW